MTIDFPNRIFRPFLEKGDDTCLFRVSKKKTPKDIIDLMEKFNDEVFEQRNASGYLNHQALPIFGFYDESTINDLN